MEAARWQELRELFDAVCALPSGQWRERLQALSDDPVLIEEALALLQAQTASLDRALRPLSELMAALPETELQVGDRLGQWQLVERLASGGMGTVFVAERVDGLFRQRVAIKLLRGVGSDPGIAGRMAEERRILAGLGHPGIARLFDGGTTPSGHPYLVMEYIDGPPLDAHCRHHGLGLHERLQLFLRVCRAVQAAHQRLVVHCDLKPSNILVRDEVAPVLLDFGIARVLGQGQGGDDPSAFCTPAYASPEQLAGASVDVTSDVFSLGVLLVELMARRTTGRGIDDRDRPVPLPSVLAQDDPGWARALRGDLDAITAKACALDPAQRYPTVEAFAGDIERHLAHRPVTARAATPGYRAGRWLRRHWRLAAIGVMVATLVAVFVWRVGTERDRAEREAREAQLVSDFLVDAFDVSDPDMHGSDSSGPDARDILDLAAARLDAGAADSPLLEARMQAVLGSAYRNLGHPQRAEARLEAAAEGFLAPDVDRPELAGRALGGLASLLLGRQQADRAVPLARRAVQLLEGAGRDDWSADAHGALGMALGAQGKFEEAEKALSTSIRLRAGQVGPGAVEAASRSWRYLGYLHRQAGQLRRAEQAYGEALRIARNGGLHRMAEKEALNGLASALMMQGRLAEARMRYAELLALVRALYGEENVSVATAHQSMVNVLTALGEFAQAGEHRDRALSLTSRLTGEQSAEFALALELAAMLDDARGDPDSALRQHRRALAIRQQLHGAVNGNVWRLESSIARLLARQGDHEAAGPLVEGALASLRRHLPSDRAGEALLLVTRAEWLLCRGDWDEAGHVLEAMETGGFESDPGLLLRRQALLAELEALQGRWPSAAARWGEVVDRAGEHFGPESAVTMKYRLFHAEALEALGDRRQARRQLQPVGEVFDRELDPQAPLRQRHAALAGRLAR